MKYVSHMGGLWRMSDRNYEKLCSRIKGGLLSNKPFDIDLDEYGKMIGTVEELGDTQDHAEMEIADDSGGVTP